MTSRSDAPGRPGVRVAFVQHGDYRETAHRFAAGRGETCGAQRYSVDFVADLLGALADEAIVVCVTAGPYDEILPNRVRGIGVPVKSGAPREALLDALSRAAPTHLVLRSPMASVLKWARRSGVRTLPMLADSFGAGLKGRLAARALVAELRRPEVEFVGNHNRNASRSLAAVGVPESKIVPWDWPADAFPAGVPPRRAPRRAADEPAEVLYVGAYTDEKGLSDAIEAAARLHEAGRPVRLTAAGRGDAAPFQALADRRGIAAAVEFLGMVERDEILERMRRADAVLVPSRKSYPEGMPKTVCEALACRTPVLVSDHPVFEGRLADGEGVAIFRAGDPADLSERLRRVLGDPEEWERLSAGAARALAGLRVETTWGDVIKRWLRNGPEDRRWLAERTLAAERKGVEV